MRIGVVGSMYFTETMIAFRNILIKGGHDAFITSLAEPFVGKSDKEKERIKLDQKMNCDAIREFWRLMQGGDAILVSNLHKNGIPNYIGANTLMEMGFAHVLNQKIFLWNPIPDMPYCKSEIEAVNPIVIYGDFSNIK